MPDQATVQSDQTRGQSDKVKIKVDGVEKEVTTNELIELAQKGFDYTKKTQSLADKEKSLISLEASLKPLKEISDEMEKDDTLRETLNKTYSDYKSGKISKSTVSKDRAFKKIDEMIDESNDPELISSLKTLKGAIHGEVPVTEFEKQIKEIRGQLDDVRSLLTISQNEKAESLISRLSEKYGEKFIGKYKDDIKKMAVKYPNLSPFKLVSLVADDEEVKEALVDSIERDKKLENERKRNLSAVNPSGVKVEVEKSKDKFGRVSVKDFVTRLKEAGKFNLQ